MTIVTNSEFQRKSLLVFEIPKTIFMFVNFYNRTRTVKGKMLQILLLNPTTFDKIVEQIFSGFQIRFDISCAALQ